MTSTNNQDGAAEDSWEKFYEHIGSNMKGYNSKILSFFINFAR
jgi:hypothetical protein